MKYFLLIALLTSFCTRSAETPPTPLKVAILSVDTKQISAYATWANEFEQQHPDITLKIDYFSDKTYKARLQSWLDDGVYDVMYWQGGKRLSGLVEQDLLIPISDLIDTQQLKQFVPTEVLEQVTYKGKIQALPFAQYSWGFYYNKEIFAENNLQPPQTWKEFLSLSETLKSNDIYPLVQANTEGWPTLAWLDYISFQIGGHPLRNKLLNDRKLTTSEKSELLNAFSELTQEDYFIARDYPWTWQQALFMVGRKQAAMTLMGQFAETAITHRMSDRMGFFNFPQFDDSLMSMAPLEVFMVPIGVSNKVGAKKFLTFLLDPKHQTKLSLNLGWLPINLGQINSADVNTRQQVAIDYLKRSPNRIQYFDRESEAETATRYVNSLSHIFSDSSVVSLSATLGGLPVEPNSILNKDNDARLFKLSAIKGHRSTFLASSILREVYKNIGIEIAISRPASTQEAISSYGSDLDGELIRIRQFENMTDELLRVPEPVFSGSLLLVSRGQKCDEIDDIKRKSLSVGVSSDALVLNQWAAKNAVDLTLFDGQEALWKAFQSGEISYVLSTQAELNRGLDNSIPHCTTVQLTTPLYHFIHKKHVDMVMPLSRAISEFKSTEAYENILEHFGLSK